MNFSLYLASTFLIISSSTFAVDFKKDIKPLLESRCVSCHSSSKQKGNLNLSSLLASTKGGDSGPAIIPKNTDESLLLERISLPHDDEEIITEETEEVVEQQGRLAHEEQDLFGHLNPILEMPEIQRFRKSELEMLQFRKTQEA